MLLRKLIMPRGAADMAPGHPLREKKGYWECYAGGLAYALSLLPCEIASPEQPLHKLILTWEFDVGTVRTGVCYSDYGPVPDDWRDVDLLFAMRWHPARKKGIEYPCPVKAGGFPLVIDGGKGDIAAFMKTELPRLRAIKDGPQIPEIYFNKFHFRSIGHPDPNHYPHRRSFAYHLRKSRFMNLSYQKPHAYHDAIARHAAVLNLCGNGNSIDRKVALFCAIGTIIVSDYGLADLELPFGARFRDGENIRFIDKPEDLLHDLGLDYPASRERLTFGSRALFDAALSPMAIASWYRKCATEVAAMRAEAVGK